jgi:photosystem II stability/assembly factor-like uncharacterized protein
VAAALLGAVVLGVHGEAGAIGAPTFVSDGSYATPSYQPGPVGCSGATTCLRLDFGDQWGQAGSANATVVKTSNGGATWAILGTLPLPRLDNLLALSLRSTLTCASTTVCLADLFGQLDRTIDGGTQWVALAHPAGIVLSATTCVASGGCLALGAHTNGPGLASYWVARSARVFARTSVVRAGRGFTGALSCTSSTRCLAGGETSTGAGAEYATKDPGPHATWTAIPGTKDHALNDLSCATARVCLGTMTVTSRASSVRYLAKSTDGGVAWSTLPLGYPTSRRAGSLTSANVSCAASLSCVASIVFSSQSTGPSYSRTIVTNNGGRTFTTRTTMQVAATQLITPIDAFGSCLAANHCVADVGVQTADQQFGGVVEVTRNEVNWTPVTSLYTPTNSTSLSCTGDDTCYRIDEELGAGGYRSQLLVSNDDGTTWQDLVVPAGNQPLLVAGCQSSQVCEVVAVVGTSLVGGLEGQELADLDRARVVLLTTSNGGASWSSSPATTAGAIPLAASCTSTLACVLLVERIGSTSNEIDVVATTNATVWTTGSSALSPYVVPSPVLDANVDQFVVSCAPGGFCVYGGLPNGAGGPVLYASTNGGLMWSKLASLPSDSSIELESLDCTAPQSCLLEYAKLGSFVTDVISTTNGGSSWSAPSEVTTSSTAPSASLSCTTAELCTTIVAELYSAPAVLSTIDGGTSWTDDTWAGPTPTLEERGYSLVGQLSCSATACLALDETLELAAGATGSMTLVQATS